MKRKKPRKTKKTYSQGIKKVKHASGPMKDIDAFHKKFKRKAEKRPTFLPISEFEFRLQFLQEEIDELAKAYAARDLEDYADSWVDIVYVALGGAHLSGLPFDKLWKAVHKANMQKKRAATAGDSKRGYACDIVKPKNWKPANLVKILEQHGGLVVKTGDATDILIDPPEQAGEHHEEAKQANEIDATPF